MYKEIKGDLLELFKRGKFRVIAHGANCYNTMGAGIAKQIADRFPAAYVADSFFHDMMSNEEKLGCYSVAGYSSGIIFNLYTQDKPGKSFDINAFNICLYKLSIYLHKEINIPDDQITIGLPMIGCGIGGGNWKEVKKSIKKYLKDFDVTVVKYDPNSSN